MASRNNSSGTLNGYDATDVRTPMSALTPLADAADFNATFSWETGRGLPTHVQDLVGTTVNDKPVLGEGANVPGTVTWQLDSGWTLDVGTDGIITWGFFDGTHSVGLNNSPGFGEGDGYSPFTPAQQAAARVAIHNWDDLIAPNFVETNHAGSSEVPQTDILLANTTTGPAQAWAYYPYDKQYEHVGSDVWIADPRINGSNSQFLPGQYGLQTLNHELGHTLGLSHPGSYNFGDDNDGDGQPDPINYTGDAQYFQDSNQFTIMSYFDSYETGAQNIDWNVMRFLYPSTPMVDDVYVVQQKYGADMTTRTGDTTYGFNATSDVWNEAMRFHKGEMATIFTIWDAGGKDTLDLSGYATPSVIDLREGGYSSAGGYGAYDARLVGRTPTLSQINADNAAAGMGDRTEQLYEIYFRGVDGINEGLSWKAITGTTSQHLMQQNIGIAYGAIVEDAKGGSGNDRINGNQADNHFWGNGGADTFIIADYSGTIPTPSNPAGKTIVDTSIDTIEDFNRREGDKIDLASFGHNAVSNLSYTNGDLHFSANSHDYTVHLLGAQLNLSTDIIYG
ncbi:MAG: M10 family metallopeptidase C-terminal domain-containing protein [Sphingomicrobium sp.]